MLAVAKVNKPIILTQRFCLKLFSGALYDHLPSERKKHYFGIDISQAAIDSAKLSSGVSDY